MYIVVASKVTAPALAGEASTQINPEIAISIEYSCIPVSLVGGSVGGRADVAISNGR